MELRLLITLLKKNTLLIVLVTLASTVGALGYSLRSTGGYDVSVSLTTNYETKDANIEIEEERENQDAPDSPYYEFDGYYAFQAAERFSQVVVGVLKGASASQEIYNLAQVPIKQKSISALSKTFKPEKQTERVVEVLFSAQDEAQAGKLATALGIFMQGQAAEASKAVDEGTFTVITSTPVIMPSRSQWAIFAALGLLGGLFLSVSIALLMYYFKETA